MYVLHQFIVLFFSPTVSKTMCMQIVVLTEKKGPMNMVSLTLVLL